MHVLRNIIIEGIRVRLSECRLSALSAKSAIGPNPTFKIVPVVAWWYLKADLQTNLDESHIANAAIGNADPAARRVIPDLELIVFPNWLVSHRELTTSRRILMVYDFLVTELQRGLIQMCVIVRSFATICLE